MCTARLIANPVAHKLKAARDRRSARAAARSCRPPPADAAPPTSPEHADRAPERRGRGAPRRRAGAAAHVRALVADGASVAEQVREIVAACATRATRRCWTTRAASTPPASEPRAAARPAAGARRGDHAPATRAGRGPAGGDRQRRARRRGGRRPGRRGRAAPGPARGAARGARGSAAVYVPGGRAPYPSTVVMGVVTARSAGVVDVAVCAPPGADGQIDPVILGTCRLCGVERVYRMGGAQAIAALAYGTETVERVDVIVGPGNLYVQEAKHQLSALVGIDGFAGPSDLLVALGAERRRARDRAPGGARHARAGRARRGQPRRRGLALGARSATRSQRTLRGSSCSSAPRSARRSSRSSHVAGAREALALANAFAPEHLQLIGAELEALAPMVRAAAACSWAPTARPRSATTSRAPTTCCRPPARRASPRCSRRATSAARWPRCASARARPKLAAAGAPIARAEGFEVHAESMEARVRENQAVMSSAPPDLGDSA